MKYCEASVKLVRNTTILNWQFGKFSPNQLVGVTSQLVSSRSNPRIVQFTLQESSNPSGRYSPTESTWQSRGRVRTHLKAGSTSIATYSFGSRPFVLDPAGLNSVLSRLSLLAVIATMAASIYKIKPESANKNPSLVTIHCRFATEVSGVQRLRLMAHGQHLTFTIFSPTLFHKSVSLSKIVGNLIHWPLYNVMQSQNA
jgi:hypothetical protein